MSAQEHDHYLTGRLLVAMPAMPDQRFAKSVIYLCVHNEQGAMGIVVNKPLDSLSFPDLLAQLDIEPSSGGNEIRVQFGGPVETARGFVLHSPDYRNDGTMVVDDHVALTATIDILKAIARGEGPRHSILALGYAGWGPGQLDNEIRENGWLSVDADDSLLFATDLEERWARAMAKIGIDPAMLSDEAGHA
jgi:putative transcriptional regulator